jgi:4-hydroxy-tetrahydrodipicolinate reductase
MLVKFAVVGYGKMGREVERAAQRRGHRRVALIDPLVRERGIARGVTARNLRGAEVAFEFSRPGSAEGNVDALVRAGVAVVCGTTGWSPSRALRESIGKARRGVVIAPNFSLGMALFSRVVSGAAAEFLGAGDYDPYLVEKHHRAKRDAPSGTALHLARRMAADAPSPRTIAVGVGQEGPVEVGAIHVASVRAGHEPGVHEVGFDGEFDTVTLTHRARGRGGLAWGAVLAAEWLATRRGLHTFEEVVEDLIGKGRRS